MLPKAERTLARLESDFPFPYDKQKLIATKTNSGYHQVAAITVPKTNTPATIA
jgi:hypothetical protein